ncbi:uncharacterized protein LOC121405242 [Drosophila obscura]|uniref:uncharacterized protein LOC121405242 n=1 Tax=Drosophila obscura TaxID=7282 RepID=UPI001BB17736|nr:uncharacterized protein LOC121405242 [Drosophila obscura]
MPQNPFASSPTTVGESVPQNQTSALISCSTSLPHPLTIAGIPNNYVLLATAIVLVRNRAGTLVPCRTILDSASQLNFITSRPAGHLQLNHRHSPISISGIGKSSLSSNKAVEVVMQSQDGGYKSSFTAVVTKVITDYQPHCDINAAGWDLPKNISLADPLFYRSQQIDMLMGAGLFFDLICIGQIQLAERLPSLQNTKLGWIVSGGLANYITNRCALAAAARPHILKEEEDSLSEVVKRFWELENCYSSEAVPSSEDTLCERLFKENCARLENGQYSVRLLASAGFEALGDSFCLTLRRFKGLETKLLRNPSLKAQYSAFLQEYLDLGHMSLASNTQKLAQFFLPHHCVQKLDSSSTKLLVVFDGSAKTTSGRSLNDLLMAGPTIQPKIFNTLVRFRFFKIALCGDICKMYRCVRISNPDEYLQCILWREAPTDEIKVYKLETVTYGTKPAAFLAIRAMHQLSYDEEVSFPIGAQVVRRDFYVDDLMSGGDTI